LSVMEWWGQPWAGKWVRTNVKWELLEPSAITLFHTQCISQEKRWLLHRWYVSKGQVMPCHHWHWDIYEYTQASCHYVAAQEEAKKFVHSADVVQGDHLCVEGEALDLTL
jgi:hypothetical protein